MDIKKAWQGRFTKRTNSLVNEFNSSITFDIKLYREDILGSQIHAKMLAKQNLISAEDCNLIVETLDEIKQDFENNNVEISSEHEDIHMLIESLLIKKIGEIGKKLHTGRSRNDQVALDLRLYARNKANSIKNKLEQLAHTLSRLSEKHKNDIMPGYTHLQQAQPISLGDHIGAYHAMLQRDLIRLENWHNLMNFSPLGAGSFAGSSLPLDREFVAKELKFTGVIKNTIDAVSDRDFIIELNSVISICMMHLSRLSEDLIIWATTEFGFIELDDAFSTGSSLMPNKKNPDVIELIRGKTGRVFGNLISILTVMKGLPLAYNKDMQEDKECMFDSAKTLLNCLEVMSPFMESVNFKTDLMKQRTKSGYMGATAILEKLVLKGLPFREAHHKVGEMVLEAIQRDIELEKVAEKFIKNL